MVAAVLPLVRATTAGKCHCQLLFCSDYDLFEIHFLSLKTYCQGRKDPNSNLLCPFLDREHLTANGSVASSQMRHSSVLGLLTLFHSGFIFFTLL